MKKYDKKDIILLSVVLLSAIGVLIAGTIFIVGQLKSPPPSDYSEEAEGSDYASEEFSDEYSDEVSEDDDTQVREISYDIPAYNEADSTFSFNLYDINYSIPVSLEALLDRGWNFFEDTDEDITLEADEAKYIDLSCPGDHSQHFQINARNFSSSPANIRDCQVVCISIFSSSLEKLGTDATFYDGKLSLASTTREEVLATMGEPKYTNDSSYSTAYTFRFDDDFNSTITVSFNQGKEHPQWVRILHEVNP